MTSIFQSSDGQGHHIFQARQSFILYCKSDLRIVEAKWNLSFLIGKSITGHELIEHVWALLDRLHKKTVKPDSHDELLQLLHSTWTEITKIKDCRSCHFLT